MRYNVAQLLKGPTGARQQHDLNEVIAHLDQELEPVRPLVGSIMLTRTSQGILVSGLVGTSLRTACRRCLEVCDVEVELALEEEFFPVMPIGEASFDDVPQEERDEAVLIDENHMLDLSEVIRQGLWVAGPMEATCRPDCAGLCHHCGGNRNLGECHCDSTTVDPRWAALQTFRSGSRLPEPAYTAGSSSRTAGSLNNDSTLSNGSDS